MKFSLFVAGSLVVFGSVLLADGALAKEKKSGGKDPCLVAADYAKNCKGENCAVDPDIELTGRWQRVGSCIRPYRKRWKNQGPGALVDTGDERRPVSEVIRGVVYRALVQANAGAALEKDPSKYVPVKDVMGEDLAFKSPVRRIAQLNDKGEPYNSMSQTGLARTLFIFSELAEQGGYPEAKNDQDRYVKIAEALVGAVVAPVEQGGLANSGPCEGAPSLTCKWYHSITRDDRETEEGGTLNQNLHAIRDILLVDKAMKKAGLPANPAYAAAVGDGLNQLFVSKGHTAAGRSPNLADFMSNRSGSGPDWAFYGYNAESAPPAGGYFLKSGAKNCSYHNHVLGLMMTIIDRAEDLKVAPEAREKALSCQSPLRRMYLATTMKTPAPASAPAGSAAEWCEGRGSTIPRRVDSYYKRVFESCGKPN
jgi:hypothetical protein